ncbi:p48 polypeptide of DNA primase [Microbotryomycetes sp. JL201]|nr:p48 polypeptide of DNA primase [Microbotryomycetes sp. JL201]
MPGMTAAHMGEQHDVKMSDPSDGVALDDLFADDVRVDHKLAAANLETMSDLSNPFVMLTYYRRLLPYKQLFLWLNHSQVPSKQFTHREFAMTLKDDVYLRYNSYADADEFKKDILRLNPTRFEIGPVYTGRPKDRKVLMKSNFKPILRELVFDLDMTDYKGMCKKCWQFIAMAVKVLDTALRGKSPNHDFGFKHLLWVYSGRRGIHLWISDPEALALTDDQRKALVAYIEVVKGGAKMDRKVNLSRPLHPSLARSLATLRPYFSSVVLNEQDCLAKEEQWQSIQRIMPAKDKEKVAKYLARVETKNGQTLSASRWAAFLGAPGQTETIVQDIILQYTYPRIDTEVSKKQNHLLKSPFCIHPGTGRVCVPLQTADVEGFDPESVPTVGQLLMELEHLARDGDEQASWDKTSLKPYVEAFERHIAPLVKADVRKRKAEQQNSLDF